MMSYTAPKEEHKYVRNADTRNIGVRGKGYYKLFRFKNDRSGEILMSEYDTESTATVAYRSKITSKILTHGFTVKLYKTYNMEEKTMLMSYIENL